MAVQKYLYTERKTLKNIIDEVIKIIYFIGVWSKAQFSITKCNKIKSNFQNINIVISQLILLFVTHAVFRE